jgi:NitT/TauT family transport system permease protein
VGVIVALLLAWHFAVARGGFGQGFVPTPLQVVEALLQWMGFTAGAPGQYSGTWVDAALASTVRVLAGFAAAAALGIPLGILVGRFRIAADLFDPVIQLLRPIPVSAWVPFSLVFFGIQPTAAIFLVAIGAFFPVVLNTAAGARHVSDLHLRSAAMLGASGLRTLGSVVLPGSLPSILTGLRVAMGLAWVLVIVAEMVAVKSGLGYELWNAYYYSRMDIIVAAMLTIGVFGFVSDKLILLASSRLLRWHKATDR